MSAGDDKVLAMVLRVVKEVNEELGIEELEDATPDTVLYGPDGKLDSLGLVNLVSEIEDQIEEEFGEEISLADERAMSQEVPPFTSIKSLVAYIRESLDRG